MSAHITEPDVLDRCETWRSALAALRAEGARYAQTTERVAITDENVRVIRDAALADGVVIDDPPGGLRARLAAGEPTESCAGRCGLHLDIDALYARIETYIASIGGAANDPERADAHAIVVRFLAPNVCSWWTEVMPLEPHTDVDLRTGALLTPIPQRVKASLERLGFEVDVETDQPARMRARRA